jgi:hypothetical protein
VIPKDFIGYSIAPVTQKRFPWMFTESLSSSPWRRD